MKQLIIGVLISLYIGIIHNSQAQEMTQDSTKSKKQERHDRKQAKALEFEREKIEVRQMAEQRNLVLEANTLSGKFGYNAVSVGANNYILIDSSFFILQTSSPGFVGQNGIGGVTIRGTIESYEVTEGGKNSINIIAQVNTFGLGPATIALNLIGKENCRATFSTASGLVLNLMGPISKLSEAKVYQGIRLY